jgi:hypothetical protein
MYTMRVDTKIGYITWYNKKIDIMLTFDVYIERHTLKQGTMRGKYKNRSH